MHRILIKAIAITTKLIPFGIPIIILRGPLKGFRLIAGAAAGPAKGLSYLLNLSEPKWLETGKDIVSKDSICLDIGANIGMYSLLFSRFAKFVYSFEPLPRNFKLFKKMMIINKIDNIKFYSYAISSKKGIMSFKEGSSVATGGFSKEGKLKVWSISLDSFIENKKIEPNVIKIDVEGAEVDILKGAQKYLKQKGPILLLETHGKDKTRKVFQILRKLGYNKFNLISSKEKDKSIELMIKRC